MNWGNKSLDENNAEHLSEVRKELIKIKSDYFESIELIKKDVFGNHQGALNDFVFLLHSTLKLILKNETNFTLKELVDYTGKLSETKDKLIDQIKFEEDALLKEKDKKKFYEQKKKIEILIVEKTRFSFLFDNIKKYEILHEMMEFSDELDRLQFSGLDVKKKEVLKAIYKGNRFINKILDFSSIYNLLNKGIVEINHLLNSIKEKLAQKMFSKQKKVDPFEASLKEKEQAQNAQKIEDDKKEDAKKIGSEERKVPGEKERKGKDNKTGEQKKEKEKVNREKDVLDKKRNPEEKDINSTAAEKETKAIAIVDGVKKEINLREKGLTDSRHYEKEKAEQKGSKNPKKVKPAREGRKQDKKKDSDPKITVIKLSKEKKEKIAAYLRSYPNQYVIKSLNLIERLSEKSPISAIKEELLKTGYETGFIDLVFKKIELIETTVEKIEKIRFTDAEIKRLKTVLKKFPKQYIDASIATIQNFSRYYTLDEMEQQLIEKGWPKDLIKSVFKEIKGIKLS